MIAIRRDIHKHAEGGFKEFRTQKVLKEALLSFGIPEESIKTCAQTGLVVDIKGKGEPSGQPKVIAIRADMDALNMPEENPHLEYKTVTDHAHMCGHDGHMTMLLAATQVFASKLEEIPGD